MAGTADLQSLEDSQIIKLMSKLDKSPQLPSCSTAQRGFTVRTRLGITQYELAAFCRRNHIKRLAFFGSVLRDDFGPESDIDVLYAFDDDVIVGWDIVRVIGELSGLLGRKVDFVPFEHLAPRLRDHILAEARIEYVAA